jgi:hypothetical protein
MPPGTPEAPGDVTLAKYEEEIVPPQPNRPNALPSAEQESDPDFLIKRVTAIPLDIRPPKGELPSDLGAAAFAKGSGTDERRASQDRGEVVVSWTPWTICYRPLYFEEIGLERYGCSSGIWQPGISAAHFFTTIPLLPYKMMVRLPRSCVCSNGFSRCDDCPPPGYTTSGFRLDGAMFEAAIVAGIVLSLP